MIEVFIHSRSTYMDVESIRYMAPHTYCSPEAGGTRAVELYSTKLAGRLLPEEDLKILQEALKVSERTDEELKVYDISRMGDKIRAMERRVRKTPTIIINGEKHIGFEESQQALSSMHTY